MNSDKTSLPLELAELFQTVPLFLTYWAFYCEA